VPRLAPNLLKSTAIKKTADGFTYIDPGQFHELFAADLSPDQAAFMARSQVFNLAENFSATITSRMANKAKLDVGGGERSHNQPRTRTLVCSTRQEPQS
jgi:hypothetical protein